MKIEFVITKTEYLSSIFKMSDQPFEQVSQKCCYCDSWLLSCDEVETYAGDNIDYYHWICHKNCQSYLTEEQKEKNISNMEKYWEN